jgi:hypothetical protein
VVRCREEEEEGKQAGKGVWVGFYRRARPVEERGREGVVTGRAQGVGRRRRSSRMRGSRSAPAARRGKARGGQRRRLGRQEEWWGNAWKGGAELQELGKQPAAAGHARAEAEELEDSGKTMEDLGAKSRKARDSTVM